MTRNNTYWNAAIRVSEGFYGGSCNAIDVELNDDGDEYSSMAKRYQQLFKPTPLEIYEEYGFNANKGFWMGDDDSRIIALLLMDQIVNNP